MAKREKVKKEKKKNKVLPIVIVAFVATYLLAVIFGFTSNDNYTASDHSESLSENTTTDNLPNENTPIESPESDSTDSPDDESTAPSETTSTEPVEDDIEVPPEAPVATPSDSEADEQPDIQEVSVIPADSSSTVEPEPTPEPEPEPTPDPNPEPEPEPEPEPVETETVEPTQVADPEQAFRDSLSQYNYVGSAESNKYHYPSCRWTDKINDENLVYWDTVEEAQAAGYQACGTCKPT